MKHTFITWGTGGRAQHSIEEGGFSIKWFSLQILSSAYILYRMVWPGLFYRMPTNIDALYKKAGAQVQKSKMVEYGFQHPKKHQKFSIKKLLYMRYVPHHFIEEIGRGIYIVSNYMIYACNVII